MLGTRVFFGALMILMLIGIVYLDAGFDARPAGESPTVLGLRVRPLEGFLITAVLSLLLLKAADEMYRLAAAAGRRPLYRWSMLMVVVLCWLPFVARHGPFSGQPGGIGGDHASTLAACVTAMIGACALIAARRRTDGALSDIGVTLLTILYLGLLGSYIARLRMWGPPGAAWLVLYYVVIVKLCDIGAYFTGLAVGRTKLIPWLSPNKTIEGLLGGLLLSVGGAIGIAMLVRRWVPPESHTRDLFPDAAWAAAAGLILALAGQAGDLVESLFKRAAGSKDSADVVPAFGGVLDLIDSPLLAAPIAYWLLLK